MSSEKPTTTTEGPSPAVVGLPADPTHQASAETILTSDDPISKAPFLRDRTDQKDTTVVIVPQDGDDDDGKDKISAPHLSFGKLFWLFLYFGFNAWGGPVAQIALLKERLVDKDKWISPSRFNRVFAVYQILPGPEAAELCCYFGYLSRGRLGALIAGLGFVLPGFVLMLVLSYVYTIIGLENMYFNASFKALQPVVAGFVVRAVHKISEHAFIDHKTKQFNSVLFTLALLAAFNSALHLNFFINLAVFGIAFTFYDRNRRIIALLTILALYAGYLTYVVLKGFPSKLSLGLGVAKEPEPGHLTALGLLGGLLSFGGAYTAIPFIQQEAVLIGGWITQQQFLDGIALGNVLPAPLVIFATFVGFIGGKNGSDDNTGYAFLGAILMTIGMFIPCFSFTIIGHDFFQRLVDHGPSRAFFEGVTGSVVGLIAVTAFDLVRASLSASLKDPRFASNALTQVNHNAISAVVFICTLLILYHFKKRSTTIILVVGAAIAGQFLYLDGE
ncbi:hypothetical protein HK097_000083 [Rhizophlyctis rosea]|uniref:Chromate transporter n=1 Tax=Rhizophlyctis rosea TaxID=64517 RepID=A0AAD5SGK6_9FUNG|nr:hypothetical protein HK097_000083 [Rhizophlyctis rosea]